MLMGAMTGASVAIINLGIIPCLLFICVQVEAGKRRDMYQRNQLLHKIQDETEKARSLLDARAQLQQQRKMANMGASFQRQKLLQAMEKLQTSKDWAKNGSVSMDTLLKANH